MFEYDLNIVQTELENMKNICDDIDSIFNDINSIGTQARQKWSGYAADLFKSKYNEMVVAFDSYKELLNSAIEYVKSTTENATNVEDINLGLVEDMF